jgi:hypothetical protein
LSLFSPCHIKRNCYIKNELQFHNDELIREPGLDVLS